MTKLEEARARAGTAQAMPTQTTSQLEKVRERVQATEIEPKVETEEQIVSTTSAFKTPEDILNYAKQNNIKVVSHPGTLTNPNANTELNELNEKVKQQERLINMFSERDGYDYLQDYYDMINGNKKSRFLSITREELLSEGIEEARRKYREALVAERYEQSLGTKINKNVLQPLTSFMLGIGEGSGGGAAAKAIMNKTLKDVAKVESITTGEDADALYKKLKEETATTPEALESAYNKLGNNNLGRVVGNTTGYITAGTVLTNLGLPPTLAYAGLSGANTYAQTDDIGDIAFSTAKGALFGKINQAIGGATKGVLEKIPLMAPIMSTTNPTTLGSVLQFGGNVTKNVLAGGAGMYGATAITGEAENLYNLIRGRDVTKEDWLKPVWSDETLTSTIIGGVLNGITGTATDMKKAKLQLQTDYNKLGQDLNSKNNEIRVALQKGDVATAQKLNNEAIEMINKFTNTQYLGHTLNANAKNILLDFWNNVAYANTQANYKPITLKGDITQQTSNNISNLQISNTKPKQITNSIENTLPKGQNMANFQNRVLHDKITAPNMAKAELGQNKAEPKSLTPILPKTYKEVEESVKSRLTKDIQKDIETFAENNTYKYEGIDESTIDGMVEDILKQIYTEEERDYLYDVDLSSEVFNEVAKLISLELEKHFYTYNSDNEQYEPDIQKLEDSDEIRLRYNQLPSTDFEYAQLRKIRERIDDLVWNIQKELPDGIDMTVEESRASADATYITIYNENTDEIYEIRVGNHFKSGVSGNADEDISISDFKTITKLEQEIRRAIDDGFINMEIEKKRPKEDNDRYDAIPKKDVDIKQNEEYTTRTVERKQEPSNYVYKKITDKDKARVSSDYLANKEKYKDKNFVHFDDVSYGYIVKNDEVEVVRKFKGSQKFIRDVEEAWENGVDKLSNGDTKITKSIRSAKRRSNTSNGISRGQPKSGNGNREITRYGGQQGGINSTETTKNNGNNLKNSEQQGSNFMPENKIRYDIEPNQKITDNQGRELSEGQQEYFKDSKARDENGNLKVMYHGTPNGDFTIFRDGAYFTDDKEYADTYQHEGASSISTGKVATNPKTFEVYLNIKKPFDINDAEARNIYINEYIKGGNAAGINPYLSDVEYDKIKTVDWVEGEDLRDFLIENGYDYDGLILDEGGVGGYGEEVKNRGLSYVVFNPNQIKNVDNLNPTDNPNILKDADVSSNMLDGFYSQLESTIINKMPKQASSKDVMNLIQKNGVKQDEIAWTGIDDFLASKETVTKEEVLEYIRANQIEIEEVIKDDGQKVRYEQREDEIRKEMDDLYYEALKIMEKYNIHMRIGDPFDTIDVFLAEHGEDEIYNLVDLENFAERTEGGYYFDGETGEYFTLDEMHKEIDSLYDLYNQRKDLEEELEEIPETAYGYADEFEDATKFKRFATKFSNLGKNYREILFRLPNAKDAEPYYKREHWDDISNIFAHTRLQDYEDDSGAKVLFVEEIQSDMHQEGRKEGYHKNDDKVEKLNKEIQKLDEEIDPLLYDTTEIHKKARELDNEEGGEYYNRYVEAFNYLMKEFREAEIKKHGLEAVTERNNKIFELRRKRNALAEERERLEVEDYGKVDSRFPFKKNWHEFVIRKIINEAVKQGYDKVAWTTGKQQNDRYDLSKYIDEIEYAKNDDGTHDIYVNKKNQIVKSFHNQTEKQLEELIGKELTNKIVNDEGEIKYPKETDSKYEREIYSLSGLALEIGGEGMKGFYDKIIPEYLNKYLKKWDSKVEEVIIPDGSTEHTQQGFKITPKMIEAVNTVGQPLYEKTTEGQRANVNRVRNAVMDLLGVEELGNKEILDKIAIEVNYALNRNKLDDNAIQRIVNDVSENLVNVTEPTTIEKRIKAILRDTKIYVPDNVKTDIVGWNEFRKNLMGTLKLTKDNKNEPIDTLYGELNEMFGEDYFPSNITNETDMLKKIAKVGKSIRTRETKFKKHFINEYGEEAWQEILESLEKELQDIREELSYEIDTDDSELKLTPELFTALSNVGIPIEMLEEDKSDWAKGIAQFFSDDYKYYEKNLKDIEKQNLETGTRTTNYILNKRRIDVLLGRVPRNEKYGGGVSPRDIRESIEKSINKKLGIKGFRERAYGIYKPDIDAIRIKNISNIETAIHELGHRIDYKVLKDIVSNESPEFRKELNALSQRAFLNTYDTPEMKRLTKLIAKTKDTIKNLEKFLDVRNNSKRINPNSKVRLNAKSRLEKAKIDLVELDEKLEKAIVSDSNKDNLKEGWAEATKRFVADNESFIKEYPETAKYILNEMDNNKSLNKQLTDLITLAEKYVNSTSEEQVAALVSVGEDTDKQGKRKFFDQYMYNMHDDLWDIKKWQKNISKAKGQKYYETKAVDNIYTLMRLNKSNEDAIINSLKYGIISDSGVRVSKGITDIIESLDTQEAQMLRNFLVSRRTLDYFARGMESGVQVADAIALINHYSKNPKLVQIANDLVEVQNRNLEYLGKDFIKKEDLKELRKWNRLYIPLKRVFDGKTNSSTGGKQLSKLTKERTGSQRDIIDPLESIIQNQALLISKKRNNDLMKKIAQQIEASGYSDIAEEIDPPQALKAEVSLELFKNALEEQGIDTDEIDLEVVTRVFNPKLNDEATMTIGFMDNGKLKALQFKDKNVYDIVSGGATNEFSNVLLLADKVTGLLRLGATQANLEFALPNVISDTMGAWLYSESGFIPGIDSIKGVIDYMMANYDWANNLVQDTEYGKNNKYIYDLYMQSGATMATRVASYRPEVQDYLKEIFGKNAANVYSKDKKTAEKAVKEIWEALKKTPHTVQDLLTAIPELSEQGTRFANFKKDYTYFKKKGYTHKNAAIQAAINTRDITTDFNRMGNYFRAYNRIKAFSAARAQSIYRFAEALAKQPKKVLSKIAAMVAISIAILKASIDSDRKEYEEIADQTKKDNFIITLPNGEFLKIKKPQGTVRSIINFFEMMYGVSAGTIPEAEYEKEWNNWLRDTVEENSGIELDLREGRDIFQIVSGSFLPTVLEPIIENAQNVDFYYGNPVVPYGKENLKASEQYDENTSQTAILLGQKLNMSPAKIENLITGWFAGVGQQALDISDTLLGKFSDDIPEQPNKNKSEQFITNRFFANPYKNSDSVSIVYEKVENLEKLVEYGEATDTEKETLAKLKKATATMKELNKQIKETRNSLKLNAEEKQNKINELQELRTDTARYYLGKELINNQHKNQIELYEYYPASDTYKYEPNKLTKVEVTLTEIDKKKYAEICKEEYEKAMNRVENTSAYKKATEEEKKEMRDSELSKARNKAKEEVSKEIYKRNKGAN